MTDALEVSNAKETLEHGGILLYPTDTLYGLGVDALNVEAIKKLKKLKGRDEGKPISIVVSDLEMAERYAEVDDAVRKLAEKFLPGPLTLVLKKKNLIPDELTGGEDTVGIRIPANEFCLALAKAFGRPYTSTSANVAGTATLPTAPEILEQFGARASMVDFVVDAEKLLRGLPTTVVDLSGPERKILRGGTINAAEIEALLAGVPWNTSSPKNVERTSGD